MNIQNMESNPVSSCSSTLWATASKEWVIPAKPKPGRKPKKETNIPVGDLGGDRKERRAQNRTAQRAFRERKHNQLADLQARLYLYEQGEIERNVALQTLSKRLKEENTALKKENALLKAQVESMQECTTPAMSTFAGIDLKKHASSVQTDALDSCRRKRLRGISNSDELRQRIVSAIRYPDSRSKAVDVMDERPGFSSLSVTSPFIGCGLCTAETECICRAALGIRTKENHVPINHSNHSSPMPGSSAKLPQEKSILDDLPAFQPAVPLRTRTYKSQSVFHVLPASNEAKCSGDPANCAACADDPFGQAFCTAFDIAVGSFECCSDCPRDGCNNSRKSTVKLPSEHPTSYMISNDLNTTGDNSDEIVSREVAWKRLKSHPNAPFADLRLLAEVVVKSSSCRGPVSNVIGYEGQFDPPSVSLAQTSEVIDRKDDDHLEGRGHPTLVPQDVLVECGKRRILNIHEGSIQEALRLLDARLL